MSETIQSLEAKYQELDLKYKAMPRRKWMFRLSTLAFVVISFLLSVSFSVVKQHGVEMAQSNYLECEDVDELRGYFDNDAVRGNPEAMYRLEKYTIGIPNDIALSGLSRSCGVNTEYRNSIGEVEGWRDNKSGKLNVSVSGKSIDSGNIKVSEIIATDESIFFINADNSFLYELKITDGNQAELVSEYVLSFAVIGNQLFVLKRDGVIRRYDLEDGSFYDVVTNAQRFYVAGTLIVQNGTSVYTIDLDGRNKTELITGALLVGADKEYIYVTDFGTGDKRIIDSLVKDETIVEGEREQQPEGQDSEKTVSEIEGAHLLYSIRVDNRQIEVIGGTDDFIRAVYSTDEGVVWDTLK